MVVLTARLTVGWKLGLANSKYLLSLPRTYSLKKKIQLLPKIENNIMWEYGL